MRKNGRGHSRSSKRLPDRQHVAVEMPETADMTLLGLPKRPVGAALSAPVEAHHGKAAREQVLPPSSQYFSMNSARPCRDADRAQGRVASRRPIDRAQGRAVTGGDPHHLRAIGNRIRRGFDELHRKAS